MRPAVRGGRGKRIKPCGSWLLTLTPVSCRSSLHPHWPYSSESVPRNPSASQLECLSHTIKEPRLAASVWPRIPPLIVSAMPAFPYPSFPGNTLGNRVVVLFIFTIAVYPANVSKHTCSVWGTVGDGNASEGLCLPGASVHINTQEIPRAPRTCCAQSFFGTRHTSIIPCGVFTEHRHSWLPNSLTF